MKIDPSLCRWTSMGGVDVQAILKSILVYLKTTQLLIMYRPLVMRMTLETKQLRIDTDGLDRIRICKVCQAGNLELFLHGMVTTHPPKIASFPDSAKSCQSVKSRLKMASSHEIQYHRSLLTCYQEHQHRSALAPTVHFRVSRPLSNFDLNVSLFYSGSTCPIYVIFDLVHI